MTVDFQEHFWSDKQNGFDILYQNLKCGSTSAKELQEFLTQRKTIEEYNFNLLIKLSARKTNNQQFGTFQPLWTILKSSTEKLSSLHMQTLQRLNQLIKEVTKYSEEHHKKQKQIKTEETSTIDAITELKETIAALNKAKEFYYAKTVEVDKLKRENASQKDIEKAEARANKACGEYKTLIEKQSKVSNAYEKKFRQSCKNFQKMEEEHLKQMKDYLTSYFQILESGHTLIGQVHKEFQNNCREMTTDRLLELFVKSKGTGAMKAGDIQFEEANPNTFPVALNSLSQLSSAGASSGSLASGKLVPNYTSSSVDLINLDLMPSSVVSGHLSSGHDFVAPMELPSSLSTSSAFTSSTSNLRKEGNHRDHFYVESSRVTGDTSAIESHYMPSSMVADDASQSSVSNCVEGNLMSNDSVTAHHKSFPDVRLVESTRARSAKWFLRNKKTKDSKKSRSSKKNSDDDDSTNGSISGSKMDLHEKVGNGNTDFMIDAEGFTVRPTQAQKEEDRFYSSSDSDIESEDEKEKKIYVKINPLKNGTQQISASVDQLIASAGALTLAPSSQSSRRVNLSANPSPILNDGTIKRSVSATPNAFKTNETDLFDIFSGPPSNGPTSSSVTSTSSGTAPFSSVFDPLNTLKKQETATETTTNQAPKETGQLGIAAPVPAPLTDRYAALSDLFLTPMPAKESSSTSTETKPPELVAPLAVSEPTNILPLPPKANVDTSFNTFSMSNNSLSKSVSSTSIMGTTPFSVYKPLSKSFASSISSNGMMSRADSISSLSSDFRMTPISICSSRDSSPLTIGMSDTVPIAIAFQESVGGCFKGTDENLCKINIIGCIKIAFSSGIIQAFSSNPYLQLLTFRLKNIHRLDRIILSKELITQVDSTESTEFSTYEMNMPNLQSSLRRLYEQSPNARYYNLDIFKYQLRTAPGAKNAPLQMVSYWKCEDSATNLKIDFKFNSPAFGNFPVQPLRNVQFTANVDGNVTSMTSQPEGKWDSLTKQALWKFNEIGPSTANSGMGSIKAKFDLTNGPSCPSSVYVQFSSQDTILSGLEFELIGPGYRLSLVKRQFSSGRYYCEPKVPVV